MPTCRYHPLEPADRVCAPCLASKLNSLTRRDGGIRRLVESYHGSAYPDDEDLPFFSLHGIGFELEKKPGCAITALVRSESHRESAGSANAFFSCGSDMSNRLSSVDTHSEVDMKAATPSRKSDSRRYRMDQPSANFTDVGNETSNPPAVSFNPPLPPAALSSFSASYHRGVSSDAGILPGHSHPPAPAPLPYHHHQLGAFSDRLCISDMITQSMRETDIKYRKQLCNNFSQSLPKRTTELNDPNHRHGICLKTPVWRFKLFSKSSSIWRLGLKGSKVSPSKRDVEMDTRGRGGSSHTKEAVATTTGDTASAAAAARQNSSNTSRRLIASSSSQPDDSVRLWCPSPMVNLKEGSFRWGKYSDKGSGSGRKTERAEPDTTVQSDSEQQQPSSSSGVFRRLYEFTQRRGGGNSGNRSETESTSSWNNGTSRIQEIPPPRTQYEEEQAQLAANILSWMDGAAATDVQEEAPLPLPPVTCSAMGVKTGEMPHFLEPELAVQ